MTATAVAVKEGNFRVSLNEFARVTQLMSNVEVSGLFKKGNEILMYH